MPPMIRRIAGLLCLISWTVSALLAQAQPHRYVLFDKQELEIKRGHIDLNMNYVEIADKEKQYPNQTIYNFNFRKGLDGWERDRRSNHQAFRQAFEGDEQKMPHNVLVTITPLSRTRHKMKEVTKEVDNGDISFVSPEELYRQAIHHLYLGKYAPMGMFDTIPVVRTKLTDFKIVLKEKNRYILLQDTTLTEMYYISYQPIEFPNELSGCGIYASGTVTVKKRKGDMAFLNPLHGRIMIDSIERVPVNLYYGWSHYATVPPYIKPPIKSNEFYIFDGIGDFKYTPGLGMLSGNFQDFWYGPRIGQSINLNLYPVYTLRFETKRINGVPADKFLDSWADTLRNRFYRNRPQ